MAEPLGKLVTPTAFNPTGVLRALELDANDYLKVAVMNLVTPAGASFPATPASGDLFYRTDLSLLCFYDGTRWLTTHEYSVFAPSQSFTVTSGFAYKLRTDYAPYFTRYSVSTLVATTNDGSNYWRVDLLGRSLDTAMTTTIHTFDTTGDTVNVRTSHEGAPTTPNPANYVSVSFSFTKVLSPGTFSPIVAMYYRLIVT